MEENHIKHSKLSNPLLYGFLSILFFVIGLRTFFPLLIFSPIFLFCAIIFGIKKIIQERNKPSSVMLSTFGIILGIITLLGIIWLVQAL